MIKLKRKRLLWEFHNGCCEMCTKQLELKEVVIHRLQRGGSYEDHRNLMVLCIKCHFQIHQNEFPHISK